jgi:hypothetical protein
MNPKWINHQGKRILYVDYSGCKNTDDMISMLQKAIVEESKMKNGLTLANFEGCCAITTEYMNEAKKLGKEIRNEKVAKTALLGITGIRKVLLQGYQMFTGNKRTVAFSSEKEALNWLTN